MHKEFWYGKLEEKRQLEDHSIDGNMQLKSIQISRMGGRGQDSRDLGQGQVVVSCRHSKESSDFIKSEDILTYSGNIGFLEGFRSVELVCWLFVPNSNNKNNHK
jgi:hypothetical protein